MPRFCQLLLFTAIPCFGFPWRQEDGELEDDEMARTVGKAGLASWWRQVSWGWLVFAQLFLSLKNLLRFLLTHFLGSIWKGPWPLALGATGGTILGWSHERSTFAPSQALPGAPGVPGGVQNGWRGIGCGWKVDVTDHLAEIWLRCFHGIFAPWRCKDAQGQI